MQGKKRYLALVLFLLLGLITFSFANPDEQLEPVEGNVKKVSEQKDEKKIQTKFEKAEELVEQAEQNPTEEIIAEAEEAIEEAQQEEPELVQEEDLVNRLNNTEPAVDAAALISAVEKMINEATAKEDVTAAKTYFDNNGVATVTNTLEEGTVKENLDERIAYLVKVFADETAPVIIGIENNQTTNIDVELTIEDDTKVETTVTLDGEPIELDTFDKEGTYIVTVTDDAQNTTSITFTIDKTKPKFEGLSSREAHVEGYTVDVTDATEVTITLQKDHGSFEEIQEGYEITEEGTYQLVGVDATGNKYTTWIIIDKTNPSITSTVEGEYINQCTTVTVFDRYMNKVTINDDSYTRKDFTKNTKNENFKLEKEFCEEGTYTITAVDKIGKKTEKTFTIDTTAAKVKSSDFYVHGLTAVEKVFYTQKGKKITVNVKVTEQLKEVPTFALHSGEKEYVLANVLDRGENAPGVWLYQVSYVIDDEMDDGEVTFTISNIVDLAGNKTEDVTAPTNGRRVIVDTTAPTYKFYKEGSSLDKDEIQPTIIDGKLYFNQNVRVRFVEELSYFKQYIHNDFVNNENKTTIKTWTREAKTDGEHTMKVTDALGNVTEVTFVVDTTAPTYKFYKEGSSLDKDEIQPTIVDGKLYFNQNVRVRFVEDTTYFTQYIHNNFVNNENKNTVKTWTREAKTDGEHTMKVTDALGNVTEVTFVVDTTAPTYKFYKEGSSLDKDEIQPTIIDGKLYFNQNVRVRFVEEASHFTQYVHNDFVNNENKTTIKSWTREAKTDGTHTMKVTDALGHVTEVTFVIDTTPNRITQTFFRGKNNIDKVYYVTNGTAYLQFNIGFREPLAEDALVTIGGKEIKLTYDKYYKATNSHMYYGYLTILDNESEMVDGIQNITITNVTDFIGNKGFYYQTNGKVVKDSITTDKTTNGKQVYYDITAPEVVASYTEKTISEVTEGEFNDFPTFETSDNSTGEVAQEFVSGSVDPTNVGTYELVYRFTDMLGNYKDVTITVNVVDTTPPKIAGIEEGLFYNTEDTHAVPMVTDRHLKSITIISNFGELGEVSSPWENNKEIIQPGNYKLIAEDEAGNTSDVNFVVDNVAPIILLLDKLQFIQGDIIPIKPVVVEQYIDTVTLVKDGEVVEGYTLEQEIKGDANYELTVTDKAGNSATAKFTMDDESPRIKQSNPLTNAYKEFTIEVEDNNYDPEDLFVFKKNRDIPIGDYSTPYYEPYELEEGNYTLTEEGTYYILVYDKAYNVDIAKVIIDRTKPTTNLVDGGFYKEVTPEVTDANLVEPVLLFKNSVIPVLSYKHGDTITEEGSYTIAATDAAGNYVYVNFTVDSTAPDYTIPVGKEILVGKDGTVSTTATDKLDGEIEVIPNVTKIVDGVETDLGKQKTIDTSVYGVSYRLDYSVVDRAGNENNQSITTTIVDITYEVRFPENAVYTSVYNGQEVIEYPKEAKYYEVKNGVDTEITDQTITYSTSSTMKNAGTYTITASVGEYRDEIEYTITEAPLEFIVTMPSKLTKGTTPADLAKLVTTSSHYEGENVQMVDVKIYILSDGIKEVSSVEKVGQINKILSFLGNHKYLVTVGIKEEYKSNYDVKNAIDINLADYGLSGELNGFAYTIGT